MKKIIYLLTAVFVFSATSAMAHCGMCGLGKKNSMTIEDQVTEKMEKMTERLGLSDEQAAEIKTLMTEKLTKKKAIMEAKMTEIDAVKKEYSAKVGAVLDEEQKTKYEDMKGEWKKDRKIECPYMKSLKNEHMKAGMEMMEKSDDMEMKGSDAGM